LKHLARVIAVSITFVLAGVPALSQSRRATKHTTKTAPPEPVDVNDASEEELKAVPGISARTAQKIVEGRPYSSVAELVRAGIPKATLKRIGKNLTVAGQPSRPARPVAAGGLAGMVWVSPGSKVYHEPGDKWYGKTKGGRYMTEADAIAAGYRVSKER
jgi:hypothetical protein